MTGNVMTLVVERKHGAYEPTGHVLTQLENSNTPVALVTRDLVNYSVLAAQAYRFIEDINSRDVKKLSDADKILIASEGKFITKCLGDFLQNIGSSNCDATRKNAYIEMVFLLGTEVAMAQNRLSLRFRESGRSAA